MAASKVVETVILGAGTLIVIYYAVTHQDQLKMYFDKFIMSAQMQLGGSSTAIGNNTAGGDNTPTTTATPPASSNTPIVNPGTNITGFPGATPPAVELPSSVRQPLPGPAGPQGPPGPPVTLEQIKAAFPNIPSKLLGTVTPPSQADINKTQMQTDAAANQLASTVLPPPPQALNQTVMAMMQQQTDAASNQLASTITPIDPGLVNNTGMPSIVGQTPQTTTGRNMKQMMKMAMPRTQTAAQKKAGQITAAKQKGNVAVSPAMANQFCVCSTEGKWRGPGCNQANKFCTTAGSHGTGK